jgi:ABC-type dipeptide/oligopeptide/nickel transport system ATPase component
MKIKISTIYSHMKPQIKCLMTQVLSFISLCETVDQVKVLIIEVWDVCVDVRYDIINQEFHRNRGENLSLKSMFLFESICVELQKSEQDFYPHQLSRGMRHVWVMKVTIRMCAETCD